MSLVVTIIVFYQAPKVQHYQNDGALCTHSGNRRPRKHRYSRQWPHIPETRIALRRSSCKAQRSSEYIISSKSTQLLFRMRMRKQSLRTSPHYYISRTIMVDGVEGTVASRPCIELSYSERAYLESHGVYLVRQCLDSTRKFVRMGNRSTRFIVSRVSLPTVINHHICISHSDAMPNMFGRYQLDRS